MTHIDPPILAGHRAWTGPAHTGHCSSGRSGVCRGCPETSTVLLVLSSWWDNIHTRQVSLGVCLLDIALPKPLAQKGFGGSTVGFGTGSSPRCLHLSLKEARRLQKVTLLEKLPMAGTMLVRNCVSVHH